MILTWSVSHSKRAKTILQICENGWGTPTRQDNEGNVSQIVSTKAEILLTLDIDQSSHLWKCHKFSHLFIYITVSNFVFNASINRSDLNVKNVRMNLIIALIFHEWGLWSLKSSLISWRKSLKITKTGQQLIDSEPVRLYRSVSQS